MHKKLLRNKQLPYLWNSCHVCFGVRFSEWVLCERGGEPLACLYIYVHMYLCKLMKWCLYKWGAWIVRAGKHWSGIVTMATVCFYTFLMQGTLTKINIVNDTGGEIITSRETVMDHFWLPKIWNIHNDEQIPTNKSLWSSWVFILIFNCQHDLFYIW